MEVVIDTLNLLLNIAETSILGFVAYWIVHLIKLTKDKKPTDADTIVREINSKLDANSALADRVAEELKASQEVTRAEFRRMVMLLDELEGSVAKAGATGLRTEAQGATAQRDRADVATDLAEAKLVLEDVALDLADSKIVIAGVAYELKAAQDRAGVIEQSEPPGSAADAAAAGPRTTKSATKARKSRKKSS